MIVLPNARDVRTADIYDGQVTYKLHEAYPGEDGINEIRRRLTAMKWRPRDRDLLNPTLSYAVTAKWRRVQAEKGDVLGWTEQWENAAGDVVAYSFSYAMAASGADPAPTAPMEVHCSYFLAATVATIEREKRTEESEQQGWSDPHLRQLDGRTKTDVMRQLGSPTRERVVEPGKPSDPCRGAARALEYDWPQSGLGTRVRKWFGMRPAQVLYLRVDKSDKISSSFVFTVD